MSTYFRNVPYVPYRFGTSTDRTFHQNLTTYVDLIDQIKNRGAFYQSYEIIDDDRPDNLSFQLYGTTNHYWTFFLLNDKLREQGWPLTRSKLLEVVKQRKPNTVLTTRNDISGRFLVGSVVTGQSSGATGTIIKRRVDLGQIIVRGDQNFLSTEDITTTEDDTLLSLTLSGAVEEYNSIYRYEDADGNPTDIDINSAPGAELFPVTYYDLYSRENDDLKSIIVLKPRVVSQVFGEFQNAMRNRFA